MAGDWTFKKEINSINGFAEALSNENITIIGTESSSTSGSGGDQTGGELSIRQWYQHDAKWAKIYRIRDDMVPGSGDGKGKIVREKIAQFMEDSILNGYVGYSQNGAPTLINPEGEAVESNYDPTITTRDSYNDELKKNGYDPNRVTKSCSVDCSSLVYSAIKYALGDDFNIVGEFDETTNTYQPATMKIDGVTYCSDFHLCDGVIRTNSVVPVGHNTDYIFERVLPLMGYQIDVFTMPNNGIKWQYAWPSISTGIRYLEITDITKVINEETGEIVHLVDEPTPYMYTGDKAFRVKKQSSQYVIDRREAPSRQEHPYKGIKNYHSFVNNSRACLSPYDFKESTLAESIKKYNKKCLGIEDYITYATTVECQTPFNAYIDRKDGHSVNILEPLKDNNGNNITTTDPNGMTGCQVYKLVHIHNYSPNDAIKNEQDEEITVTFDNNVFVKVSNTTHTKTEMLYPSTTGQIKVTFDNTSFNLNDNNIVDIVHSSVSATSNTGCNWIVPHPGNTGSTGYKALMVCYDGQNKLNDSVANFFNKNQEEGELQGKFTPGIWIRKSITSIDFPKEDIYDGTLKGNSNFPIEDYPNGPPVYCAFFSKNLKTYNGRPLLGIELSEAHFQKLKDNLHVHIHGESDDDFPGGFDIYDFIINIKRESDGTKTILNYPPQLRRGDVIRTRAYNGIQNKYRYVEAASDESQNNNESQSSDDLLNSTTSTVQSSTQNSGQTSFTETDPNMDVNTEPYLSSSGHIAVWV